MITKMGCRLFFIVSTYTPNIQSLIFYIGAGFGYSSHLVNLIINNLVNVI